MTTEMTTMTERPAVDAGPTAYRITATQLNPHDGPYLLLECPYGDHAVMPGPCVSNLLSRRSRHNVNLGALARIAINHDARHTVQSRASAARLRAQIAALGDYVVVADDDVHPFMILNCPYLAADAATCPDTIEGQCVANLLRADQAAGTVTLGTILRLAAEHEAARRPTRPEELTAVRAELADRLAELRRTWVNRRQEALCIRETAGGRDAGIASLRADLIGQLLAELDLAVNGA
ncbi:hypothetical protein ACBJ59_61185 [Nonomuraea sp. MTCD27]|uniref:hypothetical protein n=1 Tax=Nonomuraea sp. MTCD27 TaxID=1676747 RepID=UPI0035C1A0F9